MTGSPFAGFRDPPIWDGMFATDHGAYHGRFRSLDGAKAEPFTEADIDAVLYHGQTDDDDFDGSEAAVIRLIDGRIVAWQTVWGPTGSGFYEDAYGGDTDLWFAFAANIKVLILQALNDQGRELCGIPREGLP